MSIHYTRQGNSWSAEEDRKLYDLTVAGRSVAEICDELQRSKGGITSRQVRLGLLLARGSGLIDPPPPFEPYKKYKSNRSKLHETKVCLPEQSQSRLRSREVKLPQSTQPDCTELKRLIDDHPNFVERVWTAIERDIQNLYDKKPSAMADRNVHIILSRLSPGEEYYETATLQELGESYGVSRERIRQIEDKGQL